MKIIDAHVHLGNTPKDQAPGIKCYPARQMREELDAVGAAGAVVMAFPEDMYRFIDTPEWRNRSNAYCLETAKKEHDVYPLYFVWTDYLLPEDLGQYAGIKWHRHDNEPTYDYASEGCKAFLREIRKHDLPVLLEEEFEPTVRFIKDNPELTVIIPHVGESNGGTDKMNVFFDHPKVCFDTANIDSKAIRSVYDAVGAKRVLFGTDHSATPHWDKISLPVSIKRIADLGLPEEDLALIFSGNVERLFSGWRSRVARP